MCLLINEISAEWHPTQVHIQICIPSRYSCVDCSHDFIGSALVRFERSTLPEHEGARTVVLRFLKIITPVKCVIPLYDGYISCPKEGELHQRRRQTKKKVLKRSWRDVIGLRGVREIFLGHVITFEWVVLTLLASLGGLWTILCALFAWLFGRSLLFPLFGKNLFCLFLFTLSLGSTSTPSGSKPILPFGLMGKNGSCNQIIRDFVWPEPF